MLNDSRGKFSVFELANDWVYLSIDGAIQEEVGFAMVGGIVRDQDGTWILGFNRYLGNCSVYDAESWGILDGLSLLIEQGHDKVLIQFDCLKVVTII